jgi:hypothetical protein
MEEFLISLNKAYGFFARFRNEKSTTSGVDYRRHINGHVTVFPGDLENIVSNILPHPLLQRLEHIHVSWSGHKRPEPEDISKLLRVRKKKVLDALEWLQIHNPLYQHIKIATENISQVENMPGTDVPEAVYNSMTYNEPTVREKVSEAVIATRSPDENHDITTDTSTECQAVIAELNAPDSSGETIDDEAETNSSGFREEENAEGLDVLETFSTAAMLNVDDAYNIDNSISQLKFIQQALTRTPYISVKRGNRIANALDPEFFPKTFPSLFPFGRGGPLEASSPACGHNNEDQQLEHEPEVSSCKGCKAEVMPNHSLRQWAKLTLNRYGGRFACHPVFCFLIFNMLLRSNINRISSVKMSGANFLRAQHIFDQLTPERLEAAKEELRLSKCTKDPIVNSLLRNLSMFFHAQPLSNENRLSMRKKIKSLCIYLGLPCIWFTLNPNDIDNPVKLRLAVHRDRSFQEAEDLLREYTSDLKLKKKFFEASIMDPVSSSQFFEREIQLFFKHYVRPGEDSVFGRVTRYFTAVETNMRGMLHLHGFMWLEGNMYMSDLPLDMANSMAEDADESLMSYRDNLCKFLDDIICHNLDATSAQEYSTKHTREVAEDILQDPNYLQKNFQDEANFVAYGRQIHAHSATCLKYMKEKDLSTSIKTSTKDKKHPEHPCRFKAPWPLEEKTHFTAEGLLRYQRNHRMVNGYNQAMAIGLRHNHDISMIISKTHSLSMVYYITNYATKLETPMWKRLAIAQEYKILANEHSDFLADPQAGKASVSQSVDMPSSIAFLRKVANRISTERSLSAVEVIHYLLGYDFEYHNVPNWAWISLGSLYWAIFKDWAFFQNEAVLNTGAEIQETTVSITASGRKLPIYTAYRHRGPALRKLCLYDYVSLVQTMSSSNKSRKRTVIPFDSETDDCKGWTQVLREVGDIAIPIIDGRIGTNLDNSTESRYYNWLERESVMF